MKIYGSCFVTSYGIGYVYATDSGISRVEIPDMRLPVSSGSDSHPELAASGLTEASADMLRRYYLGERIGFENLPVDLTGLPAFRQSVLIAARKILYGEVCSYGQLADACNSPNAARAVGGALASNPVPVIIPCHRVIASNGGLTGFSAPGGRSTKMALLRMEGVEIEGLLVVSAGMVMHRRLGRK